MIIAVDPGKTTGWATLGLGEFDCGQIAGRYNFYDWVKTQKIASVDTIVVEKFTITSATAKMSKQYDALFINGYLDAEAYLGEITFVEQTPSEAKGVMSDAALRKLGWWRAGREWEHAMDASRHLGVYLITRGYGGIAEKILAEG